MFFIVLVFTYIWKIMQAIKQIKKFRCSCNHSNLSGSIFCKNILFQTKMYIYVCKHLENIANCSFFELQWSVMKTELKPKILISSRYCCNNLITLFENSKQKTKFATIFDLRQKGNYLVEENATFIFWKGRFNSLSSVYGWNNVIIRKF